MTTYYVDSNASGLNDGTSWTDAYADLDTALLGSVTTNDIIHVASDHYKNYEATKVLTFPDGVQVYSVDSSTDAYTAGANEIAGLTSFHDLTLKSSGILTVCGLEISPRDDLFLGHATGAVSKYKDLEVSLPQSGAALSINTDDGCLCYIDGLILNTANSDNQITAAKGTIAYINNLTGTGTKITNLLANGGNGGITVVISNSDLSSVIAASGNLLDGFTTTDDGLKATFLRCKLPTGFNVFGTTPSADAYQVDIESCDTGNGYHYFKHVRHNGDIEEDTTTYLNATYDGTNGFSALISTSANASIGNPLRHKLCTLPAQPSGSATYTVEFVAEDSLTDSEFWIEAVYNDGTDNALGVVESSRNTDILASGTAHTTSTESWTETYTTPVKMKDSVTLTNIANGLVEVYVCLAKASTDVNVDPAVTVT